MESMSVKQMKEELEALGGSAEGCYERTDIEARLLKVRAQGQGWHASNTTPTSSPAAPPGMEHFMASMTASFNTMGDSFGTMMKQVTDKFDALDSKLDHLETKRGQLRQVNAIA